MSKGTLPSPVQDGNGGELVSDGIAAALLDCARHVEAACKRENGCSMSYFI